MLTAACGPAAIAPEPPHTEPTPSPTSLDAASLEPPEPEPAPAAADDAAAAAIASMLTRVERARELKAKTPVVGEVLGRDAVLERIMEKAEKNIPRAALEAQGEMLRAFELVDLDYEYVAGMFALIRGNVAGLYDHDKKTMVLLDDLDEDLVEQTLAHELVHALQDQHYDLSKVMTYRAGDSDRVTAYHALAEGDATSAMFEIAIGDAFAMTPDRLRFVLVSSVALSGEGGTTPRVLQSALVSPYVDGFRFVQERRKRGGWAAVDAAWNKPPLTTEQLLHQDKYEAREPAVVVKEPPLPATDWKRRDADVMGEQGLRLVLEQWGSQEEAAKAAAGWGGDRYLAARRTTPEGDENAVAWLIRFDSDNDAREAELVFRKGFTKPCSERPKLGAFAWQRRGSDLALVARGYRRSRDGKSASSTADCAQARAWLGDVLKSLR